MGGYSEGGRPFMDDRPFTADVARVKSGFVGQVLVYGQITAERDGFESPEAAHEWAKQRIARRLRKLFG